MASKSRERVLFEAEIKGLKEEAEQHRENSAAETHLAEVADSKVALIQALLDQAEKELKAKAAANKTDPATTPNGDEEDGDGSEEDG